MAGVSPGWCASIGGDIPNAPAVLAEDSCGEKEKAVEVKVRQLEGELKLERKVRR